MHEGHRDRMRGRYLSEGLEGFAPHEALELLLFYAIPRRNTNPVAHALMDAFGSLRGVLEASPQDLKRVPGVGESAAVLLSLAGRLWRSAETGAGRTVLLTRMDAARYCTALLSGEKYELFCVLSLNASMELLHTERVAVGSVSDVPSYPRKVAEAALRAGATGVVLCHNHPGGVAEPSNEDIASTQQIGAMLSAMGICLYDHLIVAGNAAEDVVSLSAEGWLDDVTAPGLSPTRAADGSGRAMRPRKAPRGTDSRKGREEGAAAQAEARAEARKKPRAKPSAKPPAEPTE